MLSCGLKMGRIWVVGEEEEIEEEEEEVFLREWVWGNG